MQPRKFLKIKFMEKVQKANGAGSKVVVVVVSIKEFCIGRMIYCSFEQLEDLSWISM